MRFTFKLKSPGEESLVYLIGYGKEFTGHKFVYSTGHTATPSDLEHWLKPKTKLKPHWWNLLNSAEKAVEDLRNEGLPVNNSSLKQRLDLMRQPVQWDDDMLEVYHKELGMMRIPVALPADKRNRVVNAINKAVVNYLASGKPDPHQLKKVIQNQTGQQDGFFEFWGAVIDGHIKLKNGRSPKPDTKRAKKSTLKLLTEFQAENPTIPVTFERMNMEFYDRFVWWMEHKRGLSPGTRGKHVKEVKSVLNLAVMKGRMASDTGFRHWPVTREEREVFTLTQSDIKKLSDLKFDKLPSKLNGKSLPPKETLIDVRDAFILNCYTGLRVSDWKKLSDENIEVHKGHRFYRIPVQKTSKVVLIPVLPQVDAILKRRKGKYPKVISEQNSNDYLKLIGQLAELNDTVNVQITAEGATRKRKWELITNHVARKVFCSSLYFGWYGKPMPASVVMLFSGHKSEKSFFRYIGAKAEEVMKTAIDYLELNPVAV